MTATPIAINDNAADRDLDRCRAIGGLCAMLDSSSDTIERMADMLALFIAPDALVAVREIVRLNRVTAAHVKDTIA